MLVVKLHAQRSVHRLRDFGNRGGRLVADLVGVDDRHPRHHDHHGLAVLALLGPGDELVAPGHDVADVGKPNELELADDLLDRHLGALSPGAHDLRRLYRDLLGPVNSIIRGKPRLSFTITSALTSLPPQVLITEDPAGKAMKDVEWLIRRHAVTILPSLASVKVLRSKSAVRTASKSLIGFADPVFDRQKNVRVAANVTAVRGIRGSVANTKELKSALRPLPQTSAELRQVAESVGTTESDIFLGSEATETRVSGRN